MQQTKTIIIIFMHIKTFWWREKILYVGIENKEKRQKSKAKQLMEPLTMTSAYTYNVFGVCAASNNKKHNSMAIQNVSKKKSVHDNYYKEEKLFK